MNHQGPHGLSRPTHLSLLFKQRDQKQAVNKQGKEKGPLVHTRVSSLSDA